MSRVKGKAASVPLAKAMTELTLLEIAELEEQMQTNPSVAIFERALRRIPSAAMYWLRYIDFLSDFPDKAVRIAERGVLVCPHSDLWKKYVALTKDVAVGLGEVLAVLTKATHGIGAYYKSGELWVEWLHVLKVVYNHQLGVGMVSEGEAATTSNLLTIGGMPGVISSGMGGVLPAGGGYSEMQPVEVTVACKLPMSRSTPAGLPSALLLDKFGLDSVTQRPDIASIRAAYQSALASPIDRLDFIWDEYQAFEQTVGASIATQTVIAQRALSSFSSRYLKSKQNYKELSKLHSAINQYVLPLPLTFETAVRMKNQIIAWRQLLTYEEANHGGVSIDVLRRRVDLAYRQCIMGGCYVSEFWYGWFLWLYTQGLIDEGLAILVRAIEDYLPGDVLLRLVHASALEDAGRLGLAEKAYLSILEVPEKSDQGSISSLSGAPLGFVQYLRFTARTQGPVATRKLFLSAFLGRAKYCNPTAVVAFARLERYAFSDPVASERVLQAGLNRWGDEGKEEIGGALVDLITDLRGGNEADALRQSLGVKRTEYDGTRRLAPIPAISSIKTAAEFRELLSWRGLAPKLQAEAVSSSVEVGDEDAGAVDLEGDVLYLDGSEEQAVGVRRPILRRLQIFKPQFDQEEAEPLDIINDESLDGVPNSLRTLLTLLPAKDHVKVGAPSADAVIKVVRATQPPVIAGDKFKELSKDTNLARLRNKEARTGELVSTTLAPVKTLNLKRLFVGEDVTQKREDGDDAELEGEAGVKKSEPVDEEMIDFLSAIADNVHRERIQYRRHRLFIQAMEEGRLF